MLNIPIEKLLEKTGSIYKLVILASRRTIELSEGAPPKIDDLKGKKLVDIALCELAEGKIKIGTKNKTKAKAKTKTSDKI